MFRGPSCLDASAAAASCPPLPPPWLLPGVTTALVPFLLCQEKELRANEARVVEARGQLATAKEDHEKLSSHFYSLNAKHEAIIVRPPSPCAACMAALAGHVPSWSNQLERAQHSMDGVLLVTCLVCTLLCRRSEMVSCRSSNP